MQKFSQDQLKRYEQGDRFGDPTATSVISIVLAPDHICRDCRPDQEPENYPDRACQTRADANAKL